MLIYKIVVFEASTNNYEKFLHLHRITVWYALSLGSVISLYFFENVNKRLDAYGVRGGHLFDIVFCI